MNPFWPQMLSRKRTRQFSNLGMKSILIENLPQWSVFTCARHAANANMSLKLRIGPHFRAKKSLKITGEMSSRFRSILEGTGWGIKLLGSVWRMPQKVREEIRWVRKQKRLWTWKGIGSRQILWPKLNKNTLVQAFVHHLFFTSRYLWAKEFHHELNLAVTSRTPLWSRNSWMWHLWASLLYPFFCVSFAGSTVCGKTLKIQRGMTQIKHRRREGIGMQKMCKLSNLQTVRMFEEITN